ncbi:MAG: hypothetical protein RSA90_01755 [Lachnospiraceae bacterium]
MQSGIKKEGERIRNQRTSKSIKDRQEGSALIMVLCALCIFVVLALTMILTSFHILRNAQQSATKEQCRITAITFSKALEKDITQTKTETGLRSYLHKQFVADTWPGYDKKESGHGKSESHRLLKIEMGDEWSKKGGTLSATVFWEQKGTELLYDNRLVSVVVKASLRGEEFSVTTQYRLQPDSVGSGNWVWYNPDTAIG